MTHVTHFLKDAGHLSLMELGEAKTRLEEAEIVRLDVRNLQGIDLIERPQWAGVGVACWDYLGQSWAIVYG
jgi:hypothetical protein